jgi:hypothetical protein
MSPQSTSTIDVCQMQTKLLFKFANINSFELFCIAKNNKANLGIRAAGHQS